jgi:hypothetical protein
MSHAVGDHRHVLAHSAPDSMYATLKVTSAIANALIIISMLARAHIFEGQAKS